MFCEMCLKILTEGAADTSTLRGGFVAHIVKKVLRLDELVSKPGYFNWSLLYGTSKGTAEDTDSNYIPEQQQDEPEETEDQLDTDTGSTDKPFSMDSYDVEEDANGETNQVRVGANWGLD
jgi:hypothetical protein